MATAQKTRRVLVCPAGCEYSADAGDYWMGGNKPFTCEHDEVEFCCSLVEYRYMSGKTDDGKEWYGTVKVVLAETVTPDDLGKEF